MPDDNFQEKTEKATPKKRQEARKKGQVAKGREIGFVMILTSGIIFFYFSGKSLFFNLGNKIQKTFLTIPDLKYGEQNLVIFAYQTIQEFLWTLLPFMVTLCIVALLANFLQIGFVWSVEALAPKASKINPVAGFKKIFSKTSLAELVKSILKISQCLLFYKVRRGCWPSILLPLNEFIFLSSQIYPIS